MVVLSGSSTAPGISRYGITDRGEAFISAGYYIDVLEAAACETRLWILEIPNLGG